MATVTTDPSKARPRVTVATYYPTGKARPVVVRLGAPQLLTDLTVKEAQDLAAALTKAAEAGTRGSAFGRSVDLGREGTTS